MTHAPSHAPSIALSLALSLALSRTRTLTRSLATPICTAAAWLLLATTASAGVSLPEAIGQPIERVIGQEDTIVDLARRYRVGFEEIRQANPGIDPWLPGTGRTVLLPARHLLPRLIGEPLATGEVRLVVNIAEMRLYAMFGEPDLPPARRVVSFPISVGRQDWRTPLGQTTIISRIADPTWTPPASIRAEAAERGVTLPDVVPAGPDNPLGQHALRLAIPAYLIHGTNKPAGIGMQVTHGCIRMYPADVAWLFDNVTTGTTVELVNQPYKLRWMGDQLWMEAHQPWVSGSPDDAALETLDGALAAAMAERPGAVPDLARAREIAALALGTPEPLPLLVPPQPADVASAPASDHD